MIARALCQLAILLALALVPAVVSGAIRLKWQKPEPLGESEVRLETARMWGDKVLWADARPRAKFEREHIRPEQETRFDADACFGVRR